MSQGRQTRDGATVRRVQVMLDEDTIERAKALGVGNLSIGLRKMAKEAEMRVVVAKGADNERQPHRPSITHQHEGGLPPRRTAVRRR